MRIAAISPIEVVARAQDRLFSSLRRIDVAFDDGAFVRIPAGFVFDGASVPGLARSFVPSLSIAGYVAFCLHDYAYARGARYIAPSGKRVPISRQRADWMALALCEWLGLDCAESLQIYEALRLFGASHYRKKGLVLDSDLPPV